MFDFVYFYDWSHFLFWANIISGLFSIALIIIIGVIITKLNYYNFSHRRSSRSPEDTEAPAVRAMSGPWGEIVQLVQSPNAADWSVAILKADSLVDTILKKMQLKGQTMGERLQWLDTSQLSALDDLWEAHRIRNQIAHSPEKTVSQHMAKHAIRLYENVLKEWGYIE